MTRLPLLLAAIAATACSASAAENDKDRGPLGTVRWIVDEAEGGKPGEVQLSFRTGSSRGNSNWSHSYALADLPGFSPAALQARANSPVRFALRRPAGQLDCSGTAGSGQGTGTCAFAANAGFAQQLVSRGIGHPTERQSYSLTLGNVGLEVLDELARNGYQKPDIDTLVSLGIFKVTPDFVRSIAAAGYRLGDPEGLVKFRIFDIDADYIRAMAAIGPQFQSLGAEDLVQFKIFKVSPELVRAYSQLGYDKLDRQDLVAMSIHGVSPSFITEMARFGYRGVPAQKLVEMRIHGITPEFVRGLQQEGIALPSPDQLVRLRLAGFRPR